MNLKDYLLSISRQVVSTLLVTATLTLIAFLFPFSRDFVIFYWREALGVLLFFGLATFVIWRDKKLTARLTALEAKSKNPTQAVDITPLVKRVSDIESQTSKFNEWKSNIDSDVYELKRRHLLEGAQKHEDRHERGALLCRLEVVALDSEKDWEFYLEESLDALETYVKKEKSFSATDVADAVKSLNKVKRDGFKDRADRILSQMRAKLS